MSFVRRAPLCFALAGSLALATIPHVRANDVAPAMVASVGASDEALKTIPVGWELTFQGKKLFNPKLLTDWRGDPDPEFQKHYYEIYDAYAERAKQFPGELKLGEVYIDRWDNPATSLELTFEGKTYHIAMAPDPFVLELGLPPLTHEELTRLRPKLEEHLFGFLKDKFGLEPSTAVGSGHMNFGITGSFGKDPKIAARRMLNWTTFVYDHPSLGLGVIESDPFNADLLRTEKQREAYRQIVEDARNGKLASPQEVARAINRRVHADMEAALKVKKGDVIRALHDLAEGRKTKLLPVLERLQLEKLAELAPDQKRLAMEIIAQHVPDTPANTLSSLVIDLRTQVFDNFDYLRDPLLNRSKYQILRVDSADPAFTGTTALKPTARSELRGNNAPRNMDDVLDQTELFVRTIHETNQIDQLVVPAAKPNLLLSNEQKAAQYWHMVNFAYEGKATPEIYRRHARFLPKHLAKLEPWKNPRINDMAYVYGDKLGPCGVVERAFAHALASPNRNLSGAAGFLFRLFRK